MFVSQNDKRCLLSAPVSAPGGSMSNLQTALNLARSGYYVHPLRERDKIPLLPNGYNGATRDEHTIRAWWQAWPRANVGINLHLSRLVDIAPDCPEWSARFTTLGMEHTLRYRSGGGAGHWHALYRLPRGGPVARVCVSGQYDIMSAGNAVAPGSVHPSGRVYALQTELLPVEDLPQAPQWAIELLQAHVTPATPATDAAEWRELPSGAQLAHCRRFQALARANGQLRAVCAGDHLTIAGDSSASAQRAVFVNQLLRANYPHDEIRALALHFQSVLESDPKWFQADIDRLLVKYTPHGYRPESTGVIAQLAVRGGRHYEITAGELLDIYHEHADCGRRGIVLDWTVAEAAEWMHLSTGTIKRREAELIAEGLMRRILSPDRQRSYVVLSPATWDVRSQRIDMPEMEISGGYPRTTASGVRSHPYPGALPTQGDTGAGAALPQPARTEPQRPGVPTRDRSIADDVDANQLRTDADAGVDVGSQLNLAQQNATEQTCDTSCEERAHALEITHSPARVPIPAAPRLRQCGPWYYVADRERCGTTAPNAAEAWAAWAAHGGCVHSAATGGASAVEPDDAPQAVYDPAADWTARDCPAPDRDWRRPVRPRALERFTRRPDLGGDWPMLAGVAEQEEQAPLGELASWREASEAHGSGSTGPPALPDRRIAFSNAGTEAA
jgi:hypothetical protein